MVLNSIEESIATAVLASIGDPLTLGILLLFFFGLMGAILRLPGELMLILFIPSSMWIFGLGLGLSGFSYVVLFIAGLVIAFGFIQIIRR